ncbi:protein kintoun [Tenrec ecaudatus]|uniref:protein kintoun n=1 Tax=Tenrec ecaudatus TaxID=94439 RepID=UPI003F590567
MAKANAASALEDLDLSGDEVQRLTSAFQDPEFRRLFADYTRELSDPAQRRRYEEEITALERERGVEVRFVHPEPGRVLRTSLDGARRCYVNVCSNALVGAPSSRPDARGAAPGHRWSLPHSLSPGREYAGRRGTRYTVYDVVFHPDALALARRHERFGHMLDATALEAVEKQFGVKLDRRNAKPLKIKYKGTPEAAVLRTPLPGGAPARAEEPEGPLAHFPYPYPYPAAAPPPAAPPPEACPAPRAEPRPAPTEPRHSVVQRHHVDLQDYRCSRDSAPSPVPRELVVTIELPLLRSAEQAALEVTGKLLCLDSRRPDYRLRLSLPYPVDDSHGKAQFNKARRQLVVTLPVVPPAARPALPAAPEGAAEPCGTAGAACVPALPGEAGLARRAEDRDSGPRRAGAARSEAGSPPRGAQELAPKPEEPDSGRHVGAPLHGSGGAACVSARDLDASPCAERGGAGGGGPRAETRAEREGAGAMGGPRAESAEPLCPPLQCNQDEDALILLVPVPQILPQSLQGDLSPLRYKLCFSTQNFVHYSFSLQCAPENKLSSKEPAISISSNNAVIELAKSPESRGHWRKWYYGLNNDTLEEKMFVNEENVNEFLDEVPSSPFKQALPLVPPLIEVLQITDNNIQIHAKLQDQPHVQEGVNEESCLAEEGNTEHLTTATAEKEHTLRSARLFNSSLTAKDVLGAESCGSVAFLQQESLDVSQELPGKSQQTESKIEPEFIKEKCAGYSKEPKLTEEKELNVDHLSSVQHNTTVHHSPAFESIKETNMQDGSVQIIKDHVTHCAFSFQNSLLYDLD